jgi:hypothetical protein
MSDEQSDRVEQRAVRRAAMEVDVNPMVMNVLGLIFAAMFVVALIATGDLNAADNVKTYVYLSGVGAAPWAIAAVVCWGAAGVLARRK